MSTPGLVSVVMTVFNNRAYIGAAIESVLSQTGALHELIVIDDGSTDGSADVAQSYGDAVRYVYQPNAGIGPATNRGLALATGEYLAALDSDDLWSPGKTAAQLAVLAADPSCDLVFGHYEEFISPDLPPDKFTLGDRATGPRPGYLVGAMLARREAALRIGFFSETMRLGHFIDWVARARALGLRETLAPELVLRRRIHGNNTTLREKTREQDYVRVLKAHLDRRRAAARA